MRGGIGRPRGYPSWQGFRQAGRLCGAGIHNLQPPLAFT
jgi:hypothetical protein